MNFLNGIFVKVKKEITLGTLLSILVPIGTSILVWAISTGAKVEVNAEKLNQVESNLERVEDTLQEKTKDIEDSMQSNYKQLDQKIDKILHHLLKK